MRKGEYHLPGARYMAPTVSSWASLAKSTQVGCSPELLDFRPLADELGKARQVQVRALIPAILILIKLQSKGLLVGE